MGARSRVSSSCPGGTTGPVAPEGVGGARRGGGRRSGVGVTARGGGGAGGAGSAGSAGDATGPVCAGGAGKGIGAVLAPAGGAGSGIGPVLDAAGAGATPPSVRSGTSSGPDLESA